MLLNKLLEIKADNKNHVEKIFKLTHRELNLNENSIFDIQIKRSTRIQTSADECVICYSQIFRNKER